MDQNYPFPSSPLPHPLSHSKCFVFHSSGHQRAPAEHRCSTHKASKGRQGAPTEHRCPTHKAKGHRKGIQKASKGHPESIQKRSRGLRRPCFPPFQRRARSPPSIAVWGSLRLWKPETPVSSHGLLSLRAMIESEWGVGPSQKVAGGRPNSLRSGRFRVYLKPAPV